MVCVSGGRLRIVSRLPIALGMIYYSLVIHSQHAGCQFLVSISILPSPNQMHGEDQTQALF